MGADSPSHAYIWQQLVYLSATAVYLTAVVAHGKFPTKQGSALPPELGELAACFISDIFASYALVLCFPDLMTWQLWALLIFIFALCVGATHRAWREVYLDLLEPLLVLQ